MRDRGRPWRAAVGAGAILAMASMAGSTPARARIAFTAVAEADGVRVTASDPNVVPLGAPADAGMPVAQALVDSLDNSRAFASGPYPGDVVVTAPGTLRGSGLPSPDYPLYASSSSPASPHQDVTAPGYDLHAKSGAGSSTATAAAGAAGPGTGAASTRASAVVEVGATSITAIAESTAEVLDFGGVLRIGRVHSKASAVRSPDGTLHRSSELQVGDLTVAGEEVGLTDHGLVVAGSRVPTPANPAIALLHDAGLTVEYLAALPTPDGVVAPGIEVTCVQREPTGGALTTVAVFGRGAAFVSGGPPDPSGGAPTPASPGPQPTGAALTGAALTGAAPPDAVLRPPAASAPGPGSPAASGGAPAYGPAGSAPRSEAVADAAARPGAARASWAALYLILVLAGLAAVGGIQMIRMLGGKVSWTS